MPKEIPLINTNLVALVDNEDFERIASFRWYAFRKKHRKQVIIYAGRSIRIIGEDGKGITRGREMHRDIFDPEMKLSGKERLIDHKNHNTLDNQKTNLRLVTYSQSNMNRRYSESQGKRGVRFEPSKGAYRATIKVNEKRHNSSYFDSVEEAARAYNWLALKHHGEFARLNLGKDGQPLEPLAPSPSRANRQKTHCLHGHPFSGDNLYVQGTHRRCRACSRLQWAKQFQKRKEVV